MLILAKPVPRRAAYSYYVWASPMVFGPPAHRERRRTGLTFRPDWILLSYQQYTSGLHGLLLSLGEARLLRWDMKSRRPNWSAVDAVVLGNYFPATS